jgi:hypothetical protein
MPLVVIIYLLLCLLVGVLGRGRSMGVWGWFFFSVLLTPLVGALALLILGPATPPPQR